MKFQLKLDRAVYKNNSLLCVGLDPDPSKFKEKMSLFAFNKKIIDTTSDLVCCYKPQFAFYSAQGIPGIKDLQKTIEYIRRRHPQIPVILDAKRGDIGSTSEMYAREVFDFLRADAVTVNPYLGEDSITPFLQRRDKGIIVLTRTSNRGAGDFQDLKVGNDPLYLKVAKKVASWDKKYHNLLMVVGATWPTQIKQIRKVAPKMTFLVPGIGTQGGDLKKTLQNGLTKDQKGLIISSSSGIIYANNPRISAQTLRDEINRYR